MTTERPRLRDLYWAYIRGEVTWEALIEESEAQIAERERRQRLARGEGEGAASS
jgi:hypothetical protein